MKSKLECVVGATLGIVFISLFLLGIGYGIKWLGENLTGTFTTWAAYTFMVGLFIFFWIALYTECRKGKED